MITGIMSFRTDFMAPDRYAHPWVEGGDVLCDRLVSPP